MKQKILLALVLMSTFMFTGCWVTAKVGTVEYQTIWDKPGQIISSDSGGIWTITTFGDDYYTIELTDITPEPIIVQAQSKDNARLKIGVAISYRLKSDEQSIREHVAQYGLDSKTRDANFGRVLQGIVQTETRNAIANYDAYSLMANQEAIQKTIEDNIRVILSTQYRQELGKITLTTAPDFDNDAIEVAASQVVANQKLKEAATAAQDAAKIETETQRIKAQTFENPKMYALELQKLKVQEAEMWSKHNGTLIFGGGNSPFILDAK